MKVSSPNMHEPLKIVHCTSVHPRGDTRIFVKQCRSLFVEFGGTALIVGDGKGDGVDPTTGLRIYDIGSQAGGGRLVRMVTQPYRMFARVLRLKPRIVHFHDPELILMAMALRVFGYKVVYDVHENVAQQVLSKHWIPGPLRKAVAVGVRAVEWVGARAFNGIVAATPTIANNFPACKTVVVQNFPLRSEFSGEDGVSIEDRAAVLAYIGGITEVRGARELVLCLNELKDIPDLALHLAGRIDPPALRDELVKLPGWARVVEHGFVGREEVAGILNTARAGLVLLHPTPAYLDSLPVKMFEYMAAGVPVIASDFPLWRKIVEGAGCGLVVNPKRLGEIADAVRWILDNPIDARRMGARGREAIADTYSWQMEADKLVGFYKKLLGNDGGVN